MSSVFVWRRLPLFRNLSQDHLYPSIPVERARPATFILVDLDDLHVDGAFTKVIHEVESTVVTYGLFCPAKNPHADVTRSRPANEFAAENAGNALKRVVEESRLLTRFSAFWLGMSGCEFIRRSFADPSAIWR